jgi:CelD/BcsL family acetyltransferase involved in cellulose biosynthesis
VSMDDPRWTRFVDSHPQSLPFHHPEWATLLSDCYGYRPFALVGFDDDGRILAGSPFLEVRRLGGRARWVSLPFTDYCPPLAISTAARRSFVEQLDPVRRAAGISQLEVHATLAETDSEPATAVRHSLRLDRDPEAVLRTFKTSRVRQPITRAERAGVTVRFAESSRDLTQVFYGLHLQTRRRLGVPVQPMRFFNLLWDRMLAPGRGTVVIAQEPGGTPIAASVFLFSERAVVYKYSASDRQFARLRANNLVLWAAIRSACEHGRETFDFGRTELAHKGLLEFKRGWGATEVPMAYSTYGGPERDRSGGRKSELLGQVIRRSPPWICRGLGEVLYKYAA